MKVKPNQPTWFRDGKPMYYFVAEMTTDDRVMYKMFPVDSHQDLVYCQNWTDEYVGRHAVVFVKPTFVEEDKVLKLIQRALTEIGVIKNASK